MLSSNKLKIIAIFSMLIDHIGYFFFSNGNQIIYLTFRSIGRIAMPIFVFMIVEGYIHTKNLKKYIARLLIIAIVTQGIIIYGDLNILDYIRHINIVFSFVLILILLRIMEKELFKNKYIDTIARLCILTIISSIYLLIDIDYSYFAPILAMFFYITNKIKDKDNKLLIYFLYIVIIPVISTLAIKQLIGLTTIISAILLILYNGKLEKKSKILQYSFYMFFPIHYLILYLIKIFLIN